jgi:hypothetical protein
MAPILMEAIAKQIPAPDKNFPDLSMIIPCFNETDRFAACIGEARGALNEQQIAEENHGCR